MMKYLQRLGKSLMLPIAVLPAASLLLGIGYYLDPTGWGANSVLSAFLVKTGASIIDSMSILFAVGVALGMSKDRDGSAALSGLVAFLVVTTLLSTGSVAQLLQIDPSEVAPAFAKISNQFIGIISGLVAAHTYNKFHDVVLPDAFAFFSGKRLVPILTAVFMIIVSGILLYVWPFIFGRLTLFGESIVGLGAFGAAIYGFFNRLLIPVGLHHTLNSVFWFNLIGINDIGRFWGPAADVMKDLPASLNGIYHVGMYQAGYFPIMMFGLPAAGIAIYLTAKPERKAEIGSLMLAAGIASFVTGVTEPLEFSFMFLAPALYLIHALLTAVSMYVVTTIGATAGFSFSAGLIDYVLSLKNPNAHNPLLLLPIGLVFFVIYLVVFLFAIKTLNLKTPGREDETIEVEVNGKGNDKFESMAEVILEALGGKENIVSIDNCATRLRLEVVNSEVINKEKIKAAGAFGTSTPDKTTAQVIVGPKVQFVADALKRLVK
ncbi:N-acetylglucosamine-specific PTS transporter subunit IIBC [Pseudostreptobacillus hongkongensis]|uniref:N-acetylglucosamine-specific PTS transporter subunit IIBC n=1 Tax=Pseudostreptobacillus hongkongensis TaxID=1162717 RepID=UPI0028D1ECD3|nr:N-acetylglucosamine-specific PTS transporter subunit IIBC [Pseudostreptobacillus hongkongensis]